VRTPHAAVIGEVASWSDEDGWGVLTTPEGLSVFCHFSQIDQAGYRSLAPGTAVYFDYEVPGQDGCDARVLTAARPALNAGPNPPLTAPSREPARGEPSAEVSGLTIIWDDNVEG
jgi:CspA family cold shock protein